MPVDTVYPLMGDRRIELPGLLGVHAYYTALECEGRLLSFFPKEQVRELMQRYAKRYLTTWDMIAESVADLVLRQWLCRALLGDLTPALTLPAEGDLLLTERLLHVPEETVAMQMRQALEQSVFAGDEAVLRCCIGAVPHFAELLVRRVTQNNLRGWIVADYTEA